MATEAGRTRAGKKWKWFPKDSPKGYKERLTFHLPALLEQLQKRSASSPMPGGTFWSVVLQSISMNSFTQQDKWPSWDWPKPNHISQISLLEQWILFSKITFLPTPPEKQLWCGENPWPTELKITLQTWKQERDTAERREADSSYCKGEASVLGDVPVPGKDRRPAAPAWGHAWPPEVPFFLWSPKSIRHIILCKLLEHLQGKGRGCCLWGFLETQKLLAQGGPGSQEWEKDSRA